MEVNTVNKFLAEEVSKSIGLIYPPEKIKECFNLKPQDGIWSFGKKEQKEG